MRLYRNVQKNLSLWLVLFVIFLDHVGIGLVYPMFSSMLFTPNSPFVTAETSTMEKGTYLGVLLAAMPLASFFSGPILGALSDQKGRRPLFLFCLGFAIVGYFCSLMGVIFTSLHLLIFSRIIVGLADGSMGVVSAAIADLSADESTKAKNFGLYGMVSGTGFAMGPFIGGVFSSWGFEMPFIAAGLATALNLLLIWLFFQETHHVKKSACIRWAEGIRNLKRAFHTQHLRVLFLMCIFFCVGWSFFYEFLPVIWIDDYGLDAAHVGFFFALGSIVYAISSGVLIRPIVDRFKAGPSLFYSLCALGIAILLLLLHPRVMWVWLYLPVVNFLIAMVYPTYITMISDWAGADAQGEILGLSGSLQSLAFALSPFAAGFLIGANTYLPMLIGGLSMLVAGAIGGFLLKKQRKSNRFTV